MQRDYIVRDFFYHTTKNCQMLLQNKHNSLFKQNFLKKTWLNFINYITKLEQNKYMLIVSESAYCFMQTTLGSKYLTDFSALTSWMVETGNMNRKAEELWRR
jgi:hypothetical protein